MQRVLLPICRPCHHGWISKNNIPNGVSGTFNGRLKSPDWLKGHWNSRPVRIGDSADQQFQLDVYGELLDAFYTYAPLVKYFDRDTKDLS
jgi:GH15 family glucan-1,4-alpha-glucosidase